MIKGVTVYPVGKYFGAFSAILGEISATPMIAILGIPGYSKPLARGALKTIFSSGKSSQLTLGMLLGWPKLPRIGL